MKKVAILMGSESDKNIADKAIEVLEKYSIPYQLEVASAHRNPEKVREIVASSGASVYICIAGLSAALPGVVASLTKKPVIGVPVNVKLGGMDALLSIAQMPSGVPVATVGVDNGKNAAYLAMRILGIKYPEVFSGEPTVSDYASSRSSSATPAVGDFFDSFASTEHSDDDLARGPAAVKREHKAEPRGDWLR